MSEHVAPQHPPCNSAHWVTKKDYFKQTCGNKWARIHQKLQCEGGRFLSKLLEWCECKMFPSGLVSSSEGLSEVGVDFKAMSPFLTQSRRAKCLRSTCRNLLVALSLLETTMVAALSSWIVIGTVSLKPRWDIADLTCLTFFGTSQSAQSSLSIELKATDCCHLPLWFVGAPSKTQLFY